MAKENNNSANTTKFNNNKFNIQLLDTTHSSTCKNIVAKNAPFQIIITLKDTIRKSVNNNANLLGSLTKDKVALRLVYENDLDNQVHVLTTKPLDYNVYLRGDSLTIETRIHVLSSKHENNLFKIILCFGDQTIYTDSIKCVSKLVCENKKKPSSAATAAPSVPVLKVKKTMTASPSIQSTEKKTISKTIRKLKELRKRDRDLISLLYQQNKQMVDQLNTISNVVNSLVSNHNSGINININSNNTNNNNTNNFEIFSSPSQTIPYSPSSPEYNNNNNNYENTQPSYMDYPIIDTDIIDSLPTESSLNSYPSVVSQCSNISLNENEVFSSDVTISANAVAEQQMDSMYTETSNAYQISTY